MRHIVAEPAPTGFGVVPTADGRADLPPLRADLLQVAIDHTDQVILLLDGDRRIVFANRAFTPLFGFSFDEVRGRSALTVLSSPRRILGRSTCSAAG